MARPESILSVQLVALKVIMNAIRKQFELTFRIGLSITLHQSIQGKSVALFISQKYVVLVQITKHANTDLYRLLNRLSWHVQ